MNNLTNNKIIFNSFNIKKNNFFCQATFFKLAATVGKVKTKKHDKQVIGNKTYSVNDDGTLRDVKAESEQRAKAYIIDYALNNDFNVFATFTFDDKKFSVHGNEEKALDNLLKSFDNFRQKTCLSFRYLVVPEFGKKTNRLHFHGLLNIPKELCTFLYYDKKKQKNIYRCDYFYEKFGACNVVFIDGQTEAVAYYISKYITKDDAIQIKSHRYFASHGLNKSKQVKSVHYNKTKVEILERVVNSLVEPKNIYQGMYATKVKMSENELNEVLKIYETMTNTGQCAYPPSDFCKVPLFD